MTSWSLSCWPAEQTSAGPRRNSSNQSLFSIGTTRPSVCGFPTIEQDLYCLIDAFRDTSGGTQKPMSLPASRIGPHVVGQTGCRARGRRR